MVQTEHQDASEVVEPIDEEPDNIDEDEDQDHEDDQNSLTELLS